MNLEIHHVQIVDTPNGEHFLLSMRREGSDRDIVHQFPTDLLETRAAEYGLDPADLDTILDVVLYAPYAPPVAPDDPGLLHNADTIEDAQAFLLNRVKQAKGKGVVTGVNGDAAYKAAGPLTTVFDDSGTGDPVTFLKARAPMSAAHVAVKREYIQKLRERQAPLRAARKARRERRQDKQRRPRATPAELAAELSRQMQPDPNQPPVSAGGKP